MIRTFDVVLAVQVTIDTESHPGDIPDASLKEILASSVKEHIAASDDVTIARQIEQFTNLD
jgi:hypothetical protein